MAIRAIVQEMQQMRERCEALQAELSASVFEEPTDVPRVYTDDKKLSQILRNFISNALIEFCKL